LVFSFVPRCQGLFRFAPGTSGNPSGKKSYAVLTSAYRARLADALDPVAVRKLRLHDGVTIAEAIAHVVVNAALAGDIAAVREINNRCEGLPPAFLGIAMGVPQPKQEITIRVVEDAPLPPPEGMSELFDGLLNIVRTSNNPEEMTAAATLARLLRKHGNKRTA
jgi:hypothetical protein